MSRAVYVSRRGTFTLMESIWRCSSGNVSSFFLVEDSFVTLKRRNRS